MVSGRMDFEMSAAQQAWQLYWVEGRTLTDVADVLEVSPNKLNQLWRFWKFPKRRSGPRRIQRQLSDEDIDQILERVGAGESYARVGVDFGISRQRVHQLVKKYTR